MFGTANSHAVHFFFHRTLLARGLRTLSPGRREERAVFPAQPATDGFLERARAVLSKSKIRDLKQLTVAQDGKAIVLSGRVSTYYHKQLAQELLRAELGDVVVNEMQVG
jgi:hypothetical protein